VNTDRERMRVTAATEIVSLNIDELDIAELERRLEMAIAAFDSCVKDKNCLCEVLATCGTYCA
jgi:hypothetical protein